MNDKRRSFRLVIDLPASFKIFSEQPYISLGMVNEVSALGFSLTTREHLSSGQELDMLIRLPDDKRITLPVKVIWVRRGAMVDSPEYFVGVKILEPLNDQTAQYIRFYVRYFLSAFLKKGQGQK